MGRLVFILPLIVVLFLTLHCIHLAKVIVPAATGFHPVLGDRKLLPHYPQLHRPPDAVLLLDGQVLHLLSPGTPSNMQHTCVFENGATSPAHPVGTTSNAIICTVPRNLHHRGTRYNHRPPTQLLHWKNLVFESLSTPHDIIVFAKGINTHQGSNRLASNLRCVFSVDGATVATTNVTSSVQEVFRCLHPAATDVPDGQQLRVSLQVIDSGLLLPTLATYNPNSNPNGDGGTKSRICATTMVFNSAKFLREWVMYHSEIGVGRFILYDNGSEDELETEVRHLVAEGYNVELRYWPWPKTQEAGFSHAAVAYKDQCEWMAFIDVDEFVFSPDWANLTHPENTMFGSMLPMESGMGQVNLDCLEFGPSGLKTHPRSGVTQGYTCRNTVENRHKSVVRLEAVDESLLNVVHHFTLTKGWGTKKVLRWEGFINHYKHQAWEEFKMKFRRRVAAYVPDWATKDAMESKDRVAGLGNKAVKPEGWEWSFCEVNDTRMRDATSRWFGSNNGGGEESKMVWEL